MNTFDCGEVNCENCSKDKNDVLDKIRAEVEQLPITDTAIKLVTEIIDKYKPIK